MTFVLICVIQVTLILAIALTSLPFLRKRSAALRHCVLSMAILFSLLIPVFNLVVPVWNVSAVVSQHPIVAPIRQRISAMTATRVQPEPKPAQTVEDAATTFPSKTDGIVRKAPWIIWSAGVAVGLIVLLTGLVRLAAVASRSVPMPNGLWRRLVQLISSEYGLKRVVHLLESRNSSVLVTWGVVNPRVVLPAGAVDWPEERARIVLRHELAHIRRGDWFVQMAAQVLRIVYWFNPLVWIVCRRLRLESECACDDAVLSHDIEGPEYAEHLLDLARTLNKPGQSWSAALTMARASTIERRFSAMLNPALNRYPVTRIALFSMVFVGLAVTICLSVVSTASPAEPERTATVVAVTVQPPAAKPSAKPVPVVETTQNPAVRENSQPRRSRALDRTLFEVAEEGDIAEIEDLVRSGANVNAVLIGDGTPLMAAAEEGHLEAVRLLLDRGADPNLSAQGDGNPLIVAADEGHLDVVRLLLDRGADPNAAVPGDGNPLIAAASEGHADVVALLLDRGANIDQVVPGDENALIQASAEGHLNVVRLLVSRRADVNARVWIEANPWRPSGEWRTPLSVARREGHQDIVQFLISAGARE